MFTIDILRVDGYGKNKADINFSKGFNYVTGSSDKGKTFIFQCIKYMLGASTPPKQIREARGYSAIYMQITDQANVYTLHRDLLGGSLSVFKGGLDNFDVATKSEYTSSSTKNTDSISSFFLSLIGLSDKFQIRTNQYNEKQKLSYANLRDLFVVSETDIISDRPHFQPPEITTDQTLFKSLLKFILSREDDAELTTYDKRDVFNAKKNAKIELLSSLRESNLRSIDLLRKNIAKIYSLDEIEASISFLQNELNAFDNHISNMRDEMRLHTENIDSLQEEITNNRIILKKLNALKDIYHSDIKRLDFISEGAHYLNELSLEACSKCGKILENSQPSDNSINQYTIGAEAEKTKTIKLIQELTKTIESTTSLTDELISRLRYFQESRNSISVRITSQKQAASSSKSNLEKIIAYRTDLHKIQDLIEQNRQFDIDILNLGSQESKIPKMEFSYKKDIINQITLRMQRLLIVWFSSQHRVTFNESKVEFEINGESRSNYGKGMRAVYRLAIMLALIRVLQLNKIPISDFVVCDTPFTPFREKVVGASSDDGPIQRKIFSHLSSNYNDLQIIIFENKDLAIEENDKQKVNMIVFEDEGGFFPKDEENVVKSLFDEDSSSKDK